MRCAIFLIGCVGLFLLGACSRSNPAGDRAGHESAVIASADRNDTFRVAFPRFGPFQKVIQSQWDSFQKQANTGLALDAVPLDHGALRRALFESGGPNSGDWDVAVVSTDWLPEAHEAKSLADLTRYIKSKPPEDYPDGWPQPLVRLQQFGSAVLGLPYHDGLQCLIYRKDLFADETVQMAFRAKFFNPLAVPQTWSEFARVAEFLNRTEEDLYGTVLAGLPGGHGLVHDLCLQLWTRGGEFLDKLNKPQLESPEMVDALEFYRAILDNGVGVHPKSREFDSARAGMAFASGQVVMMVNGVGFAAACEAIPESKVKGKVDIAPLPHGKDGQSVCLNTCWALAIPAGSPHKPTAYDFLRFSMSRQADRQRTLEGLIGCRKSTWSDPEVNKAIPFSAKMEELHGSARDLPRLPNWTALSKVLEQMVLEAISTKEPIPAIVAKAQQKAAQLQIKK